MAVRKGVVRSGIGGDHPTLGLLIPGEVMDVPGELWSDALWATVEESGGQATQPLPVVDDEVIAGLDERLAEAAQAIEECEAIQAAALGAVARVPELQAEIDNLRGRSRRIRALQNANIRRRAEMALEANEMRRQLGIEMMGVEASAKRVQVLAASLMADAAVAEEAALEAEPAADVKESQTAP